MPVPFLDLNRQYQELSQEIEPKVLECLQSGMYINGPYVQKFEEKMAEYLGVKHVLGCSNGTDALVIALRACGVGHGDEVITTAFTFFATAEAIASIGARPIFVDVRQQDYNIDPNRVEAALTQKTKAILPVHIFGQPADMDPLNAIAKKHGIKVIEDAAQGIGSAYHGKMVGGLGDIGCFSFYPTKNLGAFGDAGMVTTNDDDLAIMLRSIKEHGAGKNGAFTREKLFGIIDKVEEKSGASDLYDPYKYYNYIIGYNSRLDAIQAAILEVKLAHLNEFNRKRAAIATYYTEQLQGLCVLPATVSHTTNCWHQYAIRTDRKQELVQHLHQNGIGAGEFYPVPMHMQKAFADLGYREGDLPVAEALCREVVCLPIFPELTDVEQEEVVSAVKAFLVS